MSKLSSQIIMRKVNWLQINCRNVHFYYSNPPKDEYFFQKFSNPSLKKYSSLQRVSMDEYFFSAWCHP